MSDDDFEMLNADEMSGSGSSHSSAGSEWCKIDSTGDAEVGSHTGSEKEQISAVSSSGSSQKVDKSHSAFTKSKLTQAEGMTGTFLEKETWTGRSSIGTWEETGIHASKL